MVMSFRKIVKPGDLNPANCLFGGQMMKWLDEAAAIYATCQLKTKQIVTKRVSDLIFENPAYQGDIIEFFCSMKRYGRTSFTVEVLARTKELDGPSRHIVTADVVFVSVDNNGKSTPHRYKE